VGLEFLNDAPFPKEFTDENILKGEAVNRDKPGPAPIRTSAPLERVSWDLFGPTAAHSFGGQKYCAVFVDHHTRYNWVYMLKEKSEMPDILKQFYADTALIRKRFPLLCLFRDGAGEKKSLKMFREKSYLGCERRAFALKNLLHTNHGKMVRLRIRSKYY
jgi:hypothetical protein